MDRAMTSLLIDPRLRLTTADALPAPMFDRFSIKSGRVHEWFLVGDVAAGSLWYPPLTVMTALASRATEPDSEFHRIVWIGRRCWPAFQLLAAAGSGPSVKQLLARSVFLDPLTDAERFWAIGQALRCPGIRAVVADGSGMSATVSRRLQLAAEGGMALGLIARPPWEAAELSHAASRWQVRPCQVDGEKPGWTIELQSCRGQHPGQDAPQYWTADWAYQVFHGTGALHLSPGMGRGIAASQNGGARDEQVRSQTA
jgi:hypothetical protein